MFKAIFILFQQYYFIIIDNFSKGQCLANFLKIV